MPLLRPLLLACLAPATHCFVPALGAYRRGTPRITPVAMLADPFSDPVFQAADAAAHAASAGASSGGGLSDGSLLTGLLCYVAGMAALTAWDEHVLPKLQARGVLPYIPGSASDIERKRKALMDVPWVTPITAERNGLPLPSLEELYERAHRVGRSFVDELKADVVQYIQAHRRPSSALQPVAVEVRGDDAWVSEEEGVCRISEDFTSFYGQDVYICKRPSK